MLKKFTKEQVLEIEKYLKKVEYADVLDTFFITNLHDVNQFLLNPAILINKLNFFDENTQILFKLLLLGFKIDVTEVKKIMNDKEFNVFIELGILKKESDRVYTDNYIIFSYQKLYFLVDIPFYFESCRNKLTDTYIGWDSFMLLKNQPQKKYELTLDLCCGSGIQGIIYAKNTGSKVLAVDINEKAVKIAQFNVLLNGLEKNITVIFNDLFSGLNHKFDLILANPPFIPVNFDFLPAGDGAKDGMKITRKIINSLPEYLNQNGECVFIGNCFGNNDECAIEVELQNMDIPNSTTLLLNNRFSSQTALTNMSNMIGVVYNRNIKKCRNDLEKIYSQHEYFYSYIAKIHRTEKGHAVNVKRLYPNWNLYDKPKMCMEYIATQDKKTWSCSFGSITFNNLKKDLITAIENFNGKNTLDTLISESSMERHEIEDSLIKLCAQLEQKNVLIRV